MRQVRISDDYRPFQVDIDASDYTLLEHINTIFAMQRWCYETFGNECVTGRTSIKFPWLSRNYKDRPFFEFYNKEHAIEFQLTWT